MVSRAEAQMAQDAGRFWWLWLVVGILWIIIGLVILQFDSASVTTVGVIIGVMFLVAGIQYLIVGSVVEGWKWLWYLFGVVLVIAGLVSMFNPTRTFVAVADILGFVFALIGVIWLIEAFMSRDTNDLWWLTLIAGIIMLFLGVWLGGQIFLTKAHTLLVFAGIWAVMRGIIDIVLSFQVKKLQDVEPGM